MLSTLLERMESTPLPTSCDGATRASPSESLLSAITVDDSPLGESSSSTPPTSIGDSVSISSTSLKLESAEPTERASAEPSTGRSRRTRTSIGTYNVKVLSGTSIHAPKKFSKDPAVIEARRRTISGDTLVSALASNNSSTETVEKDANRLVRDGIEALDLQWSVKKLSKSRSEISLGVSPKKSAKQRENSGRRSTRSTGEQVESLTKKLSVLGKRSRKTLENGLAGLTKAKRELRNLADTPEFAKIDTKPVVHEVWSNGKLVVAEPPMKKKKTEEAVVEKKKVTAEDDKKPESKSSGKREKVWLSKGLYAGQVNRNFDWFQDPFGMHRTDIVDSTPYQPNAFMPLPMWHGQRLLHIGRDFKLPFDVCSPLPPGQPKPDEWRKTSSSKYPLYEVVFFTNGVYKTDLLAKLQPCGRSPVFSTAFHPSVYAHQKVVVTKIVRIESCFMNVMIRIVQLVAIGAQTVLLQICKSDGKRAASTELESRLSRPRIVVMVFERIAASILIKSLLSTLERLSPRMNVTGG
jgi:histone-lysine N-methyltransferase ASH1L